MLEGAINVYLSLTLDVYGPPRLSLMDPDVAVMQISSVKMRCNPIELTLFVGGPVLDRAKKALFYYRSGRAFPASRIDIRDAIAMLINLDETCARIERNCFELWLGVFSAEHLPNADLGMAFYRSDIMREMRDAGLYDPELCALADEAALKHIEREYIQ